MLSSGKLGRVTDRIGTLALFKSSIRISTSKYTTQADFDLPIPIPSEEPHEHITACATKEETRRQFDLYRKKVHSLRSGYYAETLRLRAEAQAKKAVELAQLKELQAARDTRRAEIRRNVKARVDKEVQYRRLEKARKMEGRSDKRRLLDEAQRKYFAEIANDSLEGHTAFLHGDDEIAMLKLEHMVARAIAPENRISFDVGFPPEKYILDPQPAGYGDPDENTFADKEYWVEVMSRDAAAARVKPPPDSEELRALGLHVPGPKRPQQPYAEPGKLVELIPPRAMEKLTAVGIGSGDPALDVPDSDEADPQDQASSGDTKPASDSGLG